LVEDIPTVRKDVKDEDLKHALDLFDSQNNGDFLTDELQSSEVLQKIHQRMHVYCQQLSKGRTAKLWIQYMDMVELLRQFIRAERTGNWQLDLSTLQKILPISAAYGHNLYATSANIYLKNMYDLLTTNNHPYQHFMK